MRDDPRLSKIPMAIGGDPGRRGVISTCNYLARKFGVHSAMASAQAKKRCPQLLILPGSMAKYRQASEQISTIFGRYTDLVEPLSLDEAFLDVSDSPLFEGSATRMAQAIRQQVSDEVGITISAGVAPNKFLAKVASDWNKPDGLCVVTPGQADAFTAQLPIQRIYGVGPATAAKLMQRGVNSCADLRRFNQDELKHWLGSFGDRLYQLCRGIDHRPVRVERQRKSVSVEHTYLQDLTDLGACQEQLPALLQRLQQRLARIGADYAVTGTLVKVKFDDFVQTTVESHSDGIGSESLFRQLLAQGVQRRNRPVRLLGVGVRLGVPGSDSGGQQLVLFG